MNIEDDINISEDKLKYSICRNNMFIVKRLKEKQFDKIWKHLRDRDKFYIDASFYPFE